jgi:hypothetical protein
VPDPSAPPVLLSSGPARLVGALRPGPGEARSWVERELSRADYRVNPVDRFLAWLRELWDRLTGAAGDASPLPTALLLGALALLVVAVLVLLARVRREPPGRGTRGDAALGSGVVTAAEHRRRAEAALRDGVVDAAIVEAYRALAARAVQRGLVEERPGLTAHELAAGLRPRFPEHAPGLERSARLFDLVFYGDQPAAAQDAVEVLHLEAALHDARPARVPVEDHEPTAAVPR